VDDVSSEPSRGAPVLADEHTECVDEQFEQFDTGVSPARHVSGADPVWVLTHSGSCQSRPDSDSRRRRRKRTQHPASGVRRGDRACSERPIRSIPVEDCVNPGERGSGPSDRTTDQNDGSKDTTHTPLSKCFADIETGYGEEFGRGVAQTERSHDRGPQHVTTRDPPKGSLKRVPSDTVLSLRPEEHFEHFDTGVSPAVVRSESVHAVSSGGRESTERGMGSMTVLVARANRRSTQGVRYNSNISIQGCGYREKDRSTAVTH
jgi:hypothetical protein